MDSSAEQIEYLTFHIHQSVYGINIFDIQEVTKVSDITTIPRSPDFVEGIINLRGNIVTILNLGKKLGVKPIETQEENHVIIITLDDEYIGLMIDGVDTVIYSKTMDIESAPANMGGANEAFFEGVLKTSDQLVGILNLDKVLAMYD